jgi:23S rRNA (pseudouridine1915-N3)-methyltransferase
VRIRVVAVGRLKDRALRSLVDDYLGRIRRYAPCDEIEVQSKPNELKRALALACEGATTVVLDPAGDALSSVELAQRLERLVARGKGVVALVIGGADGLPRAIIDESHARWSLSRLTLPHRLARLVLVEQLYRAFTIMRGEPYNH